MEKYIEKLVILAAAIITNVSLFILLYNIANFQFSFKEFRDLWLLECVLAFTLVFAELFPKRFPLKKTLLFWTLLFWVLLIPQFSLVMLAYPPLLLACSGVFMWLSFSAVLLIYFFKED
jgi:hypothetical protein